MKPMPDADENRRLAKSKTTRPTGFHRAPGTHRKKARDHEASAHSKDWRIQFPRRTPNAAYLARMRAMAPATICMVTPASHPAITIDVKDRCGSARSNITPTETKAAAPRGRCRRR